MASSRKHIPTKVEGYQSTKTELIAIYRLEFYKNKKKWKLCQDVKKGSESSLRGGVEPSRSPSPKAHKNMMNETYNIQPELDLEQEQVSPHNQAFLHEELDDPPDIVPPAAVPHNTCQHTWVNQSWPGDKSEAVWQDAQQEWCGLEPESAPVELACGEPCLPPTLPPVNPVPAYEHLDVQCEPLAHQLEDLPPAELLELAEEWLQSHGYPLRQEEYAPYYEQYGLLDESADFIRGAHGVPHSSEIDLSTSYECERVAGPAPALCGLSARGLAGAAHAHAAALRALLAEHALREKLQLTPTSVNLPIPLEEYPTRDTDPPRPPDMLLSGSHRPPDVLLSGSNWPPDTGRGRGRLRSERLIGIGLGRPYRL